MSQTPSADAGGSVTSPSSPTNSSLPVACFHVRERITKRISTITMIANGSATPIAAPKLTPRHWRTYENQRAKHHRDDSADAKDSVRGEFRLEHKKRERESD